MDREPRYLGDGVHATFDGYYIWLKTERDDSGASVTHAIALDPSVFEALLEYKRDLIRETYEGSGTG
jgi:hypothetical protein